MLITSDFTVLASDRWRAPQPVVNASAQLTSALGRKLAKIGFAPPGIMCTQPRETELDIFFRPDSDEQRRLRPDAVVASEVSAGGSFAFLGETPRLFTFNGYAFEEEFVAPYGALRLSIVNPNIDGTPSYRLKVFQPYLWHEVDAAELLFAWTRFHTSDGAAAKLELDQTTFEAYSWAMLDPLRRQRYTVWRRVDSSIADHARELVLQSNAIFGFGVHAGAAGLSLLATIREFSQLEENSAVYESEVGRDSFIVVRPTLRFADDYVANRSAFQYGQGSNIRGIADEDTYSAISGAPIPGPGQENTIRQEDAASIAALGLRPAVGILDRTLAISEQSAEGSFDLAQVSELRREIVLSMGPLHFDFCVGDVVHFSDAKLGIDAAADYVATEKTYIWDTLFATVAAREVNRSARFVLNPADCERELVGWFRADAGVAKIFDVVTTWTNQATALGSPAPNLTAPARGTAVGAQVFTAYRNGLDAVSFVPDGVGNRALDWSWTSGEESWCFLICGEFRRLSSSTLQAIFDSVGGASGALALHGPNDSDGRFAFSDGVIGKGPGISSTSTGILIAQLFRTRGNYALAGDQRTFLQFRNFATLAVSTYDDPQTARFAEPEILTAFGEAPTLLGVAPKLRGFAGNTAFGTNAAMTASPGGFVAFEILAFRLKKGDRPLRSRNLRGLVHYLEDRWK